jgi:hypothetical protein
MAIAGLVMGFIALALSAFFLILGVGMMAMDAAKLK